MQYSLKLKTKRRKTNYNYSTFVSCANGFQEIIKFLEIIFLAPSPALHAMEIWLPSNKPLTLCTHLSPIAVVLWSFISLYSQKV